MPDGGLAASRAERIAVVGGGTMGVGIFYVFAAAGFNVSLVEPDDGRFAAALATLKGAADAGVRRGKLTVDEAQRIFGGVERFRATSELPAGFDLVIETVPERLELKQSVLADISHRTPQVDCDQYERAVDQRTGALGLRSRRLSRHAFLQSGLVAAHGRDRARRGDGRQRD